MAAKPAKSRKAKDYPGGEWGFRLAERLRVLVKRAGGVRKFAARLSTRHDEFSPALVSAYLNGTRQPATKSLRVISERAPVSLDWLLFGEDGEEPRRRGETWTRVDFYDELATRVIQGVTDAAADGALLPGEDYGGWTCFAERTLDRVITEQIRVFREFREWQLRVDSVRSALRPLRRTVGEHARTSGSASEDARRERIAQLNAAEGRLARALRAFNPPPVPFVWPRGMERHVDPVASPAPSLPADGTDVLRVDTVKPSNGAPAWVSTYDVATGRRLGRSATAAENAAFDHKPDPERARRIAAAPRR